MTNKDKILFYITLIFVLSLFFYLFNLSTKYIINYWTFSQAHINYSDGFVKRGLFGTILIFLEKKFSINFIKSFNIFFIFIYFSNIVLFFLILKKYIRFLLLFLFFSLSPILILFSFNDLGGFQRFDAISIFLILLHTYLADLCLSEKITLRKYQKLFKFTIFPILFISIFIHEILCWSIPFHFFVMRNIFCKFNTKLNNLIIYFIILLIVSIIIFLYPVDQKTILSMMDNLNNKNLWLGAIEVASSSQGNFNIIEYEIKTNLLNFYNFKINLFFLLLGIIPINFLMYFFNKKNFIFIKKNNNYIYFYLSIIPYLTFFAIGDTGRWLHLIGITSFSYFAQYPLLRNDFDFFKIINFYKKIIAYLLVFIYLFFIRLPHAGNLEEKKITIWGGLYKKFEAAYNIHFKDNFDDKFNFNKRFKKN